MRLIIAPPHCALQGVCCEGVHCGVSVHRGEGVHCEEGVHCGDGVHCGGGVHWKEGVHWEEGVHCEAGVHHREGVHFEEAICLTQGQRTLSLVNLNSNIRHWVSSPTTSRRTCKDKINEENSSIQ